MPDDMISNVCPLRALYRLYSRPWYMQGAKANCLALSLRAAIDGGGTYAAARTRPKQSASQIAVLQIRGPMDQHADAISEFFGGATYDQIGADLDMLAKDRAVKAIVLDIDSPGGSVFGASELAAQIRGLRSSKRIEAVVNSEAYSAAYWLASATGRVSVTPGGMLGSIGAVLIHDDISALMEKMGVRSTLIVSEISPHKGEANPLEPLSDSSRREIQAIVDRYGETFARDVAKGRNVPIATVKADFGQGRIVSADEAVRRGMADRVATMTDVVRGLVGRYGGAQAGVQSCLDVDLELADRGIGLDGP